MLTDRHAELLHRANITYDQEKCGRLIDAMLVEYDLQREREHLCDVIGEAMGKVHQGPPRPSVATAASKAGALMDWAADVVEAAGVEVTDDRVREHANMVAGGAYLMVFLKLGAPLGIDDLNAFMPSGQLPPGKPIDKFDALYEAVCQRVGDRRRVDLAIDELMQHSWSNFVEGCRDTYTQPGS